MGMSKEEKAIFELKKLTDPVRAEHSQTFFKTGPGEYGEGDLFLGVQVPQTRKLVRAFRGIELSATEVPFYFQRK